MALEPTDIEALRIESMMWKPTGEMRWRRPARAPDTDKVLEQLWERHTGEREWREVGMFCED